MPALDANHISILDPQNPADAESLEALLRDPTVNTVDTWADQFAALAELRPAPTSDLLDEPPDRGVLQGDRGGERNAERRGQGL